MILLDEFTIGWSDGDRLALVVRASGDTDRIVSDVRTVEGNRVEWDREEIRVEDGARFGWALLAHDGSIVVASYRDGFVAAERMSYVVLGGAPW